MLIDVNLLVERYLLVISVDSAFIFVKKTVLFTDLSEFHSFGLYLASNFDNHRLDENISLFFFNFCCFVSKYIKANDEFLYKCVNHFLLNRNFQKLKNFNSLIINLSQYVFTTQSNSVITKSLRSPKTVCYSHDSS